jgi:uncharacterized phage protein gp47/JayE
MPARPTPASSGGSRNGSPKLPTDRAPVVTPTSISVFGSSNATATACRIAGADDTGDAAARTVAMLATTIMSTAERPAAET